MTGKTLAITGALTLSLLVPAGAAVAATTDDHPGPVGRVLNVFGDHDRKDDQGRFSGLFSRKDVHRFVISGTIRSVDTDDRTITIGHGERRKTRTVKVAADAAIWRDRDRAKLGDLEQGDHVRMTGEKKNGRYVATRVRAVS